MPLLLDEPQISHGVKPPSGFPPPRERPWGGASRSADVLWRAWRNNEDPVAAAVLYEQVRRTMPPWPLFLLAVACRAVPAIAALLAADMLAAVCLPALRPADVSGFVLRAAVLALAGGVAGCTLACICDTAAGAGRASQAWLKSLAGTPSDEFLRLGVARALLLAALGCLAAVAIWLVPGRVLAGWAGPCGEVTAVAVASLVLFGLLRSLFGTVRLLWCLWTAISVLAFFLAGLGWWRLGSGYHEAIHLSLSLGFVPGCFVLLRRSPTATLDSDVFDCRRFWFWWSACVLPQELESALLQHGEGGRLTAAGLRERARLVQDLAADKQGLADCCAAAFSSTDPSVRLGIQHAVTLLGGEAVPVLCRLSERDDCEEAALAAIRQICHATARQLTVDRQRWRCPDHLTRIVPHPVTLPTGRTWIYYGCRRCGRSRQLLAADRVVCVLDESRRGGSWLHGRVLYVYWSKESPHFDYDSIEVRRARDRDVRSLMVQAVSFLDPAHRRRIAWRVDPSCALGPAVYRALAEEFGPCRPNWQNG